MEYAFIDYIVGVDEPEAVRPWIETQIRPNNPSTRGAKITFGLQGSATVSAAIVDVSGRVLRKLVDSSLHRGNHMVDWDGCSQDGNPVGSGIYWFSLQVDGKQQGKKLVVLR